MVGPILVKGHIRVTLPLKSSPSVKHAKRRRDSLDEHDKHQFHRTWQTRDPTISSQAVLTLKKKAHQFYKKQAQKRSAYTDVVQMTGGPVDPFNSWPIPPTPDVPRMAQYCEVPSKRLLEQETNLDA